MAGSAVSGPTPWWQLPEYAGKSPVLTSPAPPGYTYDPVAMGYRPIAGSPSDQLAQRARQQAIEDAQRASTDAMRAKLFDILNTSSSTSSRQPQMSSSGSGQPPVSFNYSGGGDNSNSTSAPMPMSDVPDIQSITLPDTSAASAAAFARAKDKVGAQTAGSVTALRSALAGRGMLGGGSERRGVTNILTAGQANLGDTSRDQAVSDVNRATDFAKMGYEGAISQRSQDITKRGQDIAANESAASRNLSANESAASRALSAATTDYSGRVSQRGQDLSAASDAANRQAQAKASRNASVSTLLSRLY